MTDRTPDALRELFRQTIRDSIIAISDIELSEICDDFEQRLRAAAGTPEGEPADEIPPQCTCDPDEGPLDGKDDACEVHGALPAPRPVWRDAPTKESAPPATDARLLSDLATWLRECGVRPTGKGEQHCGSCGRMSYECDEDDRLYHDGGCAWLLLRRCQRVLDPSADQTATDPRTAEALDLVNAILFPESDASTPPQETDMDKTATFAIRHETRTAVTSGTVTIQYRDERHLELELQFLRDIGFRPTRAGEK